jgi:PKHD-type hydroxylase
MEEQEEKDLDDQNICDYVVLDLFTPEECVKIQKYCEKKLKMGPGNLSGGRAATGDVRKSKVGWLPRDDENLWWVQDRIKDAILTVNTNKYHFDVNHSEAVQFTQYGCGEHYSWHHDMGDSGPSIRRKLSISVELSDGLSYDGGDLMLLTLGSRYNTIKRKQGQAVIFPSYTPHIVTEVKPKPGGS